MRGFSPHRVLAVLAGCFCLATAAHADWIRDFTIGGLYNDNVSNSNRDADRLDDFAFDTSIRLGKFAELSSALKFAFTLDFDSRQWVNYSDLDNIRAGATASLRYRFGLGAMAPFLRLEAGAHYAGFNEGAERDHARGLLGKVASPAIASELTRRGLELGGGKRR